MSACLSGSSSDSPDVHHRSVGLPPSQINELTTRSNMVLVRVDTVRSPVVTFLSTQREETAVPSDTWQHFTKLRPSTKMQIRKETVPKARMTLAELKSKNNIRAAVAQS